jgi:hypothetical protein
MQYGRNIDHGFLRLRCTYTTAAIVFTMEVVAAMSSWFKRWYRNIEMDHYVLLAVTTCLLCNTEPPNY